jgi:DNA-directed RNA polymerase specialized sigma24 family protein
VNTAKTRNELDPNIGCAAFNADGARITLDEALDAVESKTVDVLTLDETMTRLAALSERQAHIVELRVFGGLTIEETGHVLDVGPTTVKSDWLVARAWLRHELRKERVA